MKRYKINKIIAILFLFATTYTYASIINTQAISKDKTLLALVYHNDLIRIHSLKTGKLIRELKSEEGNIHSIDFNANGNKLISGTWSDYAILWDIKTGKILQKKNVKEHVMHAFFSEDDKNIALVLEKKGLVLYNKTLDQELKIFKVDSLLRISKNKQYVIVEESNNTVGIVDLLQQKIIMHFPKHSYDEDIFFCDDSNIVIIRDKLNFHIWDIQKKKEIETIHQDIEADSIALNYTHKELWISNHHKLEVWDYRTHKRKKTLLLHTLDINEIEDIAFSDKGSYVAITVEVDSGDYQVITLDTKNYDIQTIITPESKTVYSTEFINDSLLLLHSQYPVEVWDIARKRKAYYFKKGW